MPKKKNSRTKKYAPAPSSSNASSSAAWASNPNLQALLVFVAAALTFLPALSLTWIWDDDQYVYENPLLNDVQGLYRIWFVPSASPQYYPAVFSVFWLLKQTVGLNLVAFHATNVILHACNATLCFTILRQLRFRAAFWVALAFAIHPIQVETVAWITELKNVLSATFYGITWLLLWPILMGNQNQQSGTTTGQIDSSKAASDAKASSPRVDFNIILRWTGILACFLLALLSKSVTATLPAAVLVAVWFVQGTLHRRQWILCAPLFLMGVIFGLRTAALEREHVGAVGGDWSYGALDRVGIAARSVAHYVQQALMPLEQMFFYPRFDPSIWQPEPILALFLCISGVLGAAIYAARGNRGLFAAIAFFVGSAFPALGFLNVYPHRFSFVADHFVYIPIVGLLCIVWGLLLAFSDLIFKKSQNLLLARAPLVLLLSYYALMTWAYLPTFYSKLTLWETTLQRNPSSISAAQSLGLEYLLAGRANDAVQVLQSVSEQEFDQHIALQNLGLAYNALGRHAEAREVYLRATQIAPAYVRAWLNLGALHLTGAPQQLPENRIELAKEYYEKAWQLEPLYESALALAGVTAQLGDNEAAQQWFERANAFSVDDLDMRLDWANQLLQEGEPQQAQQIFLGTQTKWPEHPDVVALGNRIQAQLNRISEP